MGKMKELITGLETVGDYNNMHAGKAWALSAVWLNDSIRCLDCAHNLTLDSCDPIFCSDGQGFALTDDDDVIVSCGECGVHMHI
jgi:hypothetical protein